MERRTLGYWVGLALLGVLLSPPASACSIPVFRYALERWSAAPYPVTVFRRGALGAEGQAALDRLRRLAEGGLVNLELNVVDLDRKLDPADQELWAKQKDAALPWAVVSYPTESGIPGVLWAGPLQETALRPVIDSPARREVARRLMAGESAVWVVLESGDRTRDDAAAKLLEEQFKILAETLDIPKPDPDAGGPQLLSDLPLKLAFSVLRVSRQDPAEASFLRQLLALDPEAVAVGGPIVAPIFGRGRALGAVGGEEITAKAIAEGAEFLCGACSCQVKEMNPGTDLLIAADWLAPLEGRPPEVPQWPGAAAPPTTGPAGAAELPVRAGTLWRNLAVAGGAGVAAVAAGTFALVARARRKR